MNGTTKALLSKYIIAGCIDRNKVLQDLAMAHKAKCNKLDCVECNIYFNLDSANVIEIGE
jgi:hypothetical protein